MNWLTRHLNPVTVKRLRRFRRMKRAYWSLWALVGLYGLSLFSELLCNDVPLYVRYNGKSYFPILKHYPDDEFTGSGILTRPDYKVIAASSAFQDMPGNVVVFPPVPYGPDETIEPESVDLPDRVTLKLSPEPKVASVNINESLSVIRSIGAAHFFQTEDDHVVRGTVLTDYWTLPDDVASAVRARLANEPHGDVAGVAGALGHLPEVEMSLTAFKPRSRPTKSVRITLREPRKEEGTLQKVVFDTNCAVVNDRDGLWTALPDDLRKRCLESVRQRLTADTESWTVTWQDADYRFSFQKEMVIFPFRPTSDHWLGIDSKSRDVFARVLYGFRTSLTFGLILVACSVTFGIIVGSLQGYFGGKIDIVTQRLIEIWSAMPFLYIMILMGSIYGRSFMLLIFCYGLFNWIGMSYYMRAEFLRLRKLEFVEAARCLGLPAHKIIFRHILPNALVPVLTFFPFSLVGAIGSLTALDYLGFGLPNPSWGGLLQQAQQFRWAWWLILYPSLALFTVMLLGVFIGEGVRNAYDPRQYSRME